MRFEWVNSLEAAGLSNFWNWSLSDLSIFFYVLSAKIPCWDTIAGAGFGAIWIVPATWMPSGLAAVIKFGICWSRWSVWILWEHLVLGFSKSRLCRYIGSPKLEPLLLSAVIVPGENEFIQMAIELELMGWARHQKVQCGLKPVDLHLIYTFLAFLIVLRMWLCD